MPEYLTLVRVSHAMMAILLTVVLGGCVPTRMGRPSEPRSTREAENDAIARRVFAEVLVAGDTALARSLYAPHFRNHGQTRDVDLTADLAAAAEWRKAFPDSRLTVLQTIAEGDRVAILWLGSGTNTGQGMGLPATGRSATLRGMTIWRFDQGRIVEEWSTFDQYSLLTQLGIAGRD